MPWIWHEPSTTTEHLKEQPSNIISPTSMTDEDKSVHEDAPAPSLVKSFTQPTTILATAILTSALFSARHVYTTRLRRIPSPSFVPPNYLISRPSRSIFGPVVQVTDPDNFRIYHTPGGLLLGWHWLRSIPKNRKELSGQTIHIRIAGIDAPEMAHFGRPAQPYSDTAMEWLTNMLKGRKVRVYTLRRDQYDRIVATAFLRRRPGEATWRILQSILPWTNDTTLGPLLKKDIGLEMIKAGLATVYEARFGAEFGAKGMEEIYKEAERKAKAEGKGMWKDQASVLQHIPSWRTMFAWLPWIEPARSASKVAPLETPREYKTRMAALDAETAIKAKQSTSKK